MNNREKPLSVSAFARRVGVNESVVRKGIASGRLEACLGTKGRRTVIVDPELGDREWHESRDPSKIRPTHHGNGAGPHGSIAEDRGNLIRWQAARMELEVRRRRGELFEGRVAKEAWATMLQAFRALLLALPRSLAEILVQDALTGGAPAVEARLRQALEDCLTALSTWTPSPPESQST